MNIKHLSPVEISTIEACSSGAEYHILAEPPQRNVTPDIKAAFKHAGPNPKILDVGCGYGRLVPHLRALGPHHYIGIDPAPRMLELARSQYPDGDFRGINLYELPDHFEVGYFDLVLVPLTLSYVPRDKTPTALKALRKVTRKVSYFALMNDTRGLCITPNLQPCAPNYPGPKSTLYGYPMEWTLHLLSKTGFQPIEVHELGCGYYSVISQVI